MGCASTHSIQLERYTLELTDAVLCQSGRNDSKGHLTENSILVQRVGMCNHVVVDRGV